MTLLQIANPDSQTLSDTTNFVREIMANPVLNKIAVALITAVIIWIIQSLYYKYIVITPRLFLRLGSPLYSQRLIDYEAGFKLTWTYECELKNNSKYDAYNIKIFEVELEDEVISNKAELNHVFRDNNHISSNTSIEFEIKKTINIESETLLNITIENGRRVIHPGIKVQNVAVNLKPECLKNIRLVVKLENESGKKFFIKYKNNNGIEFSKIKRIRPFRGRKLI